LEITDLLNALGPYATPITVLLLAALAWLARDRAKMAGMLDAAQQALIAEKEKRAEMLERNYREFLAHSAELARTLDEFDRRADEVLRRLK
jgi:hypothetical protein